VFLDHLVLGASGHEGEVEFLNTGDILVTLVIFAILMLLLKKFAWGPLMGIMTQREEMIASEIEAAEKSRQESQQLLEEQRGLLKEARTEAKAIVENAKKQGDVATGINIVLRAIEEPVRTIAHNAGLEGSVIVGHRIPAGTGMREYDNTIVGSKDDYNEMMANKEEYIY
jgi:hypothetical protein